MITSLLTSAALLSCPAGTLDAPYRAMMDGFADRSPAGVANAYQDESILGNVDAPRVYTAESLRSVFSYVAPDDGRTLQIEFRILTREIGEGLASDVGLYQITDGARSSHGGFTTVSTCSADGVWRFIADLMTPATAADWNAAQCADGAICAD